MIGGRNKATPRARTVSNWSRQALGGVHKPSLKPQDTIKRPLKKMLLNLNLLKSLESHS